MTVRATLLATANSTSNANSGILFLGDQINVCVAATFTGADVAGTFKLQGSEDGTSFKDIASQSISVTASAYAPLALETAFPYIRAVWTYSSGTGNITITATYKEFSQKGG